MLGKKLKDEKKNSEKNKYYLISHPNIKKSSIDIYF